MDIKSSVEFVSKRFEYMYDKKMLFSDAWFVMPERSDGKLRGDCDDFALTCIWLTCDKNILKFIWYVLILHKYRLYFSKTKNGENHIVGYVKGYWFDNWSMEALSKQEFLEKTKHKILFFYPNISLLIFMFFGMFFRNRSLNSK